MEKLELLVALFSVLSAIIALAIKLWKTFSSLINEKKYSQLFDIVSQAIVEAEAIYSLSGEEKKDRVMETVRKAADAIGIDKLDTERISYLIETIIEITKKVNVTG